MTVNHKLVKFHDPLYLLSYKCAILKYTIYKPLLRHSTWLHTGNVNNNERPSNLSDSDLSLHLDINPFLRDRIRMIGTSCNNCDPLWGRVSVQLRARQASPRHRAGFVISSSGTAAAQFIALLGIILWSYWLFMRVFVNSVSILL